MRVRVYKNLNNGLISIQCTQKRLVIGHCTKIVLKDAIFIVSEKGRQRALKEKRKNVHAFAEGEVLQAIGFTDYKGRGSVPNNDTWKEALTHKVFYNPYKGAHFLTEHNRKASKASICSVDHRDGIFAANIFE